MQRWDDGRIKSVTVSAVTGAGLEPVRSAVAVFLADVLERTKDVPREPEDWELELQELQTAPAKSLEELL